MDYSQITPWLYIGTTPRPKDYTLLRALGVGLVVNMRVERRPHRDTACPALHTLWLPTLDSPFFPIPLNMLQDGVRAALATIQAGKSVYAHCQKGVHRGVAMGAAILIAQGHTAEAAMQLIRARRKTADPYIWYIRRRILHFAEWWEGQSKNG